MTKRRFRALIYAQFLSAQGGQVTVRTDSILGQQDRFAGGLLRRGAVNYSIVSNTVGPNATVTIQADAAPALGDITLFRALGNAAPTFLVNPTNDANLYDLLARSTARSINRFADAYIEPEQDALNAFDSANVFTTSKTTDEAAHYTTLFDKFRGTSPGNPSRPADYETDFFWSVYMCTAFEMDSAMDGDPDGRYGLGITNGFATGSFIYLEATRDVMGYFGLTDWELRPRTTVHEIGHQFTLAVGEAPAVVGRHRDDGANIMNSDVMVPANKYYFHPADIVALRRQVKSPGTP